jgi:leucyl aminopeptidase
MKVELKKGRIADVRDDLLCVFLMQDEEPSWDIKQFLKDVKKERFEGKLLQTFYADSSKSGYKHLLIIGLGKKEEFKLDFLRRAAGLSVRYAASLKHKELSIYLPGKFISRPELTRRAQAITEGAMLAGYKFYRYKTKKEDLFQVEKVRIVSEDDVAEGIRLGMIYAGAQNYARELDELPANVATPARIAAEARKLGRECGLTITVLDKKRMEKMGMNALLAVAQGSEQEALLVKLEYNKGRNHPLYSIVGKGVTFDSGGISIKPSLNMHEMKYDKTGAVNVLGVFKAVAELKLPIRLIGLMPLVENLPSGSAQKPGDIVTAYNGKTIEVLNTDAEGRMILADALSYAAEDKPECIIDMATLTGAIAICLGKHAIGLLSNDDALAKTLIEAGEETHERVWRLPLWPEYGEMIKADFADIKNISETGEAGSITAAAFLKEFVGETKWAHLDIAAVDLVKPPHPYMDKGASGIGVRLVLETLARLPKKK